MSGLREERTLGAVMVGEIRLIWAAEISVDFIAGQARSHRSGTSLKGSSRSVGVSLTRDEARSGHRRGGL